LPRLKKYPNKYRIDIRVSKELFKCLDEKRKAEGYETISELISTLISKYPKEE